MPNPVEVACPAGAWTIVATNVTAGSIKRLSNSPRSWLETYRLTGGAAPTLQSEGSKTFIHSDTAIIDSPLAGIDVYIMAVGRAGRVRRDV